MWRRVFNSRGNTTLMALFVTGIVSTGVYLISNKIITERKFSSQLRKDIHANLALRSITDYVKYGVRKSWCFDQKLLPDLPENCINNFSNAYSTARILMPLSYAKSLEELGANNASSFPSLVGKKATDLMLQEFAIQIDLNNFSISDTHPLYRILTNTQNPLIKGLKISVKRISNQTLPVNGDEVYIEITSEFTDKNKETIKVGKQFLRETTRFVSNPRELNSFTLILPGSIYLGETSPPIKDRGDLAVPKGSKSDVGLVFNSPVFVNQNIFMPSSGYTPATFNDVVIFGNGSFKDSNGGPFKINESLGIKKYWTDLQTFGGFIRGIDSDGKQDKGLNTLNGVSESTKLDNETITWCTNLLRVEGDLNLTSDSRFVGVPENGGITSNLTEATTRFSFSTLPNVLNTFEPQTIRTSDGGINCSEGLQDDDGGITCNGFKSSDFMDLTKPYNQNTGRDDSIVSYEISPNYNLASGTRLVMWAHMKYEKSGDDIFLKVPILENTNGDGHKVIINFSAYSKNEFATAEKAFKSVSATLTTKTDTYNQAQDLFQQRQARLIQLESNKPSSIVDYNLWADKKEYEDLSDNRFNNKSVASAQRDLTDADSDLQKFKTDTFNPVKNEYEKRKEYFENAGKIEITSTKPNNGFLQRQSAFRNLNIKIINGQYFKRARISNYNRIFNFSGSSDDLYQTDSIENNLIKNFSIEGMDYSGKSGGYSVRPRKFSYSGGDVTNNPDESSIADMNNVYFKFNFDSTNKLVFSNETFDFKGQSINLSQYKPLDPTINYEEKMSKCRDSAGGINQEAFKTVSFEAADFTSVAPDSWHFASANKDRVDETFSTNITSEFRISSIRKTCTITPLVTVINAFLVCENLVIQPRTQPLKFIGTFMVLKNLTIDKTALVAGVTWQSIHNQTAVKDMKNSGSQPVLRRANDSNCSTLYNANVPFWHPDPGLQVLSDRIRCSSTFVLQGKGPPRWTSVDPDCGRVGNSTNTLCLKRIRNFNLIQLERIYGL